MTSLAPSRHDVFLRVLRRLIRNLSGYFEDERWLQGRIFVRGRLNSLMREALGEVLPIEESVQVVNGFDPIGQRGKEALDGSPYPKKTSWSHDGSDVFEETSVCIVCKTGLKLFSGFVCVQLR